MQTRRLVSGCLWKHRETMPCEVIWCTWLLIGRKSFILFIWDIVVSCGVQGVFGWQTKRVPMALLLFKQACVPMNNEFRVFWAAEASHVTVRPKGKKQTLKNGAGRPTYCRGGIAYVNFQVLYQFTTPGKHTFPSEWLVRFDRWRTCS